MSKSIILKAIFVIALCVSVGVCGVWGYYDAIMASLTTGASATKNREDDDDLVYTDDVINILVVGADRRANETANGRSDSTMVVSVDMKNEQVKVTSLMRDMYIDIPGYGMDKFNSSYSYGGVDLLSQTIENNFDIKLDGYVIVDFSSFKKVINKIGGVKVNVSQKDADYLNNASGTTGFILKEKYRTVKVGKQKLNGAQALAYSRIRKVVHPVFGDGEFGRCMRQQEVIQSLLKKVKKQDMKTILSIATSMMNDVSTNLDAAHINALIKAVMNFDTSEIESLRIPYDGTYKMGRRRGMFVFLINLEANKAKLHNFIYGIGDDDADYSVDFGTVMEETSDGSTESSSYRNEASVYDESERTTKATEKKTEKTTQQKATEKTTAAPTTQATTAAPTTQATTAAPTTAKPTTAKPATTAAPATEAEKAAAQSEE